MPPDVLYNKFFNSYSKLTDNANFQDTVWTSEDIFIWVHTTRYPIQRKVNKVSLLSQRMFIQMHAVTSLKFDFRHMQ